MSFEINDMFWMCHALNLAKQASLHGEVPVGAVIVYDDKLLGEGWNQSIVTNDPTAHAELTALRNACIRAKNYRLIGATIYVTLEPCLMCAGALAHVRIKRVVFATSNPKIRSAGSVFDISNNDKFNDYIVCHSGILKNQSQDILRQFFRVRR